MENSLKMFEKSVIYGTEIRYMHHKNNLLIINI